MNKRLTASEYIMTIVLIFMLVCVAGAFFIGYQVGTDKAEARYTAILKKYEQDQSEPPAYDQQMLVSFYHTIFSPYREYQKKWFEHLNTLSKPNASIDPADMMKELARLAKDKYEALQGISTPDNSPLLQSAQQNYMKSLKLFTDTSAKYVSHANSKSPSELLEQIDNEPFFQEAINFALQAQNDYYSSIVKWNETLSPELPGVELASKDNLTLKEWSSLPLNLKNLFISRYVAVHKIHTSYYPQDIAMRLDEIISSGQAKKLNYSEIGSLTEMLISTGAVRPGDFIEGKDRWYHGQTLPQLPFFYE
jgi:hypothetical protein